LYLFLYQKFWIRRNTFGIVEPQQNKIFGGVRVVTAPDERFASYQDILSASSEKASDAIQNMTFDQSVLGFQE
jgi:hypothetical protein